MKVILLTHIKGIGQKGDIKDVNEGYFRNFLQPRKLAAIATEKAVAHVHVQEAKATEKLENMRESAESVKAKIDGKTIEIKEKASESGKLYAAVNEKEVVEILRNELKVEIPAKQIKMDTIKEAGQYKVKIELYKEVSAEVNLNVTTA